MYSGKMQVLEALLQVFEEENSKVLLFSYSTTLLSILESFAMSKGQQGWKSKSKIYKKI